MGYKAGSLLPLRKSMATDIARQRSAHAKSSTGAPYSFLNPVVHLQAGFRASGWLSDPPASLDSTIKSFDLIASVSVSEHRFPSLDPH